MIHEMAKIKIYAEKTLYRLEVDKNKIVKKNINHWINCINFLQSRTDLTCVWRYLIADMQAFYCVADENDVEWVYELNNETNMYEATRPFEEYKEDGLLEKLQNAFNIKSMMSKLNNSEELYVSLEDIDWKNISYSQNGIEENFVILKDRLAQWDKLYVPYMENNEVKAFEITGNNYGYFYKRHVDTKIIPIAIPAGTPIIKEFNPEGLNIDIINQIDNLKKYGATLMITSKVTNEYKEHYNCETLEKLLKSKDIQPYVNNNVKAFIDLDVHKAKLFVEEEED